MNATARTNPIVYNFESFDSGGTQVGSGFLSVGQAALNTVQDVSGMNLPGQAPPGSKFVRIGDLADLSFMVFGTTYRLSDHKPNSPFFPTKDGIIFNDDESFRQFIDANIPGRPTSRRSATFVTFGTIGARLLSNENFPAGFEVEGTTACPSGPLFSARCTFPVARAAVPESATPVLLLTGIAGLSLLRRRTRRQATA